MVKTDAIKKYFKLPQSPGVYLMKDAAGRVIYVGKAANLRRRVASYFSLPRRSFSARGGSALSSGGGSTSGGGGSGGGLVNDARIENLVSKIKKIDFKKTDSALEALILEAELIKKLKPRFNIREKDDKSFLYIEITDEKFPRVLLTRGRDVISHGSLVIGRYGPFTSASSVRGALKILRRIFPWSAHRVSRVKGQASSVTKNRPCFDYEIGLCPGTCIGAISRTDYMKNIKKLRMFFAGKKKRLLSVIEREMKETSKKMEYEKAEKLRRQLFALKHIRDTALIFDSKFQIPNSKFRIEGYDISNISGTSAVGSMVVFIGSEPDKSEYRKFKIRTVRRADDTGMLKEVLRRRLKNSWPLPDLILVDGGRGQVNAAKAVLNESGVRIPVVGIAKGPERRKNEFIGKPPGWAERKTLIRARDEAHRFAVRYHRLVRGRRFIGR